MFWLANAAVEMALSFHGTAGGQCSTTMPFMLQCSKKMICTQPNRQTRSGVLVPLSLYHPVQDHGAEQDGEAGQDALPYR